MYTYFFIGLFLIGLVSFIDDIRSLPNKYRIFIHLFSMSLLILQVKEFYSMPSLILFFLLLVIGVGIVNAYNFMDGINGITGFYSLITIATLYFIDVYHITFIDKNLLLQVSLSVLVFLFFNFRKIAIGFCGDVGSISIAFIVIFSITMLIFRTNDLKYIFLLGLYGIDTIYTLLFRIRNGENIFKAHRSHFYQLLVLDFRMSHLQVSILYGFVQLLLNLWILNFSLFSFWFYLPFVFIIIIVHTKRKEKGVALRGFNGVTK